jgi:hypothetical protein
MITTEELQRRFDLFVQGYWEIPDGLDTTNFDFNWKPEPYDRPYIHQFGTQHQKTGGPRYIIPENEGVKYQNFQRAIKLPDINNRCWRPLVNNCIIDYSWHPDDTDPPFIYVFGNQWYDSHIMPTYQYKVKGATDKKYIIDVKATLSHSKNNWEIPNDIDDSIFDYSWVPNPHDPPFKYEFGTQWQKTGGPKYIVEGATETKYVDTLKVIKLPEMRNWRILEEIDATKFDFSWHPDSTEPPMMYEFGTQWQKAGGPIYVTKGSTHKKYCSDQIAIRIATVNRCYRPLVSNLEFDYSWHPDPDDPPFIYVFGNQWHPPEIMPTLVYRVKGATNKKYVNEIKAKLIPSKEQWIVPDDIDDTMFDYSWCPDPTEPPFIYQFGTQWQKTGGPSFVVKGAIDVKYVIDFTVIKKPNLHNWRIIEPIDQSTFDFSWHPDDTDGNFTYVFGNKFYSPEIMPTIMYKNKKSVQTKFFYDIQADLNIPSVIYEDSIFDKVIQTKFETTYVRFVKEHSDLKLNYITGERVNTLFPNYLIGNQAIIHKDAKKHLYDTLTDYPCVTHQANSQDTSLDIIFLSNGEAIADENYEHLLNMTKDKPNRVIRIDKVNGRVASQHAAANASNTEWYFLVNGKLRINENFDFNWQPDIYMTRKHYVFTATNPINNLEYGHMAIVANNKKLTLATIGKGLDFTMDSPIKSLPINSGIAVFNSSPWDTWRTAFREVIKLCDSKDKESKNRLIIWTNIAEGDFAQECLQGAKEAVEYYNQVNGDFEKLKLSYDWDWLYQKYNK